MISHLQYVTDTVDRDGEWVMNFKLINEVFLSRSRSVPDMSQIFQLLRLQNRMLTL